jgi:hypothetical protein
MFHSLHRWDCDPSLSAARLADRPLTDLSEFLVARAAGAEMIQPFVDLCEPRFGEVLLPN